ncbi:MAG: methylthioadenosine phosphorylase [Zestosphaera tikiterensis]|uniref:S-methyl-5'-thioadenosine phosphorylase n=1 Tax=Zestosphaera tikiterensis TaxID=1973259 RepID=A0A2R7Y4F7_9CREN|nr:MAG: methylthioadenosine phosphorylase [Zestosphaera tikiterensis]
MCVLVKPPTQAEVGLIGGSGLYDPGMFEEVKEFKIYTPYGLPSDNVFVGFYKGRRVAFIPRHGRGHKIPPHRINFRANIWALKSLGVKWVVAVSAVGSLREDYMPGDIVIPDQFIDMTKGRVYTFFDGPTVAHVSMADPFCPTLRALVADVAKSLNIKHHVRGTYVCIEGPRFSTRAESRVWKEVFKADVVGMTLVPEVNLAREAELHYATIALVTDYDVWAEKPVTAEEVSKVMAENVEKAKRILAELIPKIPKPEDKVECACERSLKDALV